MKPVLYLDVDGVLWDLDKNNPPHYARAANGLREFLDLAFQHFEVRWCTAWAMIGFMRMEGRERLFEHTGITPAEWALVRPSLGFQEYKYENIDLAEHLEGRLFVWVEDGLLEREHLWLEAFNWEDRYFHTDVFKDPDALVKTTARLQDWINGNQEAM